MNMLGRNAELLPAEQRRLHKHFILFRRGLPTGVVELTDKPLDFSQTQLLYFV